MRTLAVLAMNGDNLVIDKVYRITAKCLAGHWGDGGPHELSDLPNLDDSDDEACRKRKRSGLRSGNKSSFTKPKSILNKLS
jgi:hypothetical protein